jgi:hypothetical protein
MAAGGGIMSYMGQKEGGEAQRRMYEDMAANDEKSAALALEQGQRAASISQDQGARETKDLKDQVARFEGAQKAGMAANGITGSSVTAQDIAKDTANKAAMDEAAIRYNADMRTWESNNQAQIEEWQLRERAKQQRTAGYNAETAGRMGGFASLLGGAGSVGMGAANFWKK